MDNSYKLKTETAKQASKASTFIDIVHVTGYIMDSLEEEKVGETRSRDAGNEGRCSHQASRRSNTKKERKFWGNRYTKVGGTSTSKTPVSAKKIKTVKRRKTCVNEGYRLLDIQILEDMISSLACPEFFENKLYLEENHAKKKGLAVYISIVCPCGYEKNNYMSKTVTDYQSPSKGMKHYAVNMRIVYGLRTCGLGHKGLEKLYCIMNMPKPYKSYKLH